ncbi:glutamine synthetase III family protein [Alkalitalea saponilacus]|uniref:Glutamine synthetase n=1 Tax=Alkalitalea saponilacus TaxID=889453 RepID=A0A1T5BHA8_9BACT|nr:glutamine synthetase III [Alkalitalea saponilacus]ASB49692.1 glutamine synthetase type III [Alkalitalea saponilacus]SKB46399.1 glutamine synthetase [Alkalitalea saponilacus]
MATLRFMALKELLKRKPMYIEELGRATSEYYGKQVFDKPKMKKYLSKDAYEHVMEAINKGTRIDRKMADQIALGMKAWATENGATHYTHWFHPLTDATAEKHDAFIVTDSVSNGVVESFSGKLLVQQEPDASSLPSGGLRNTFEARGYTAWDVSSPAFIVGTTLCLPTIFISYTGEALDYKMPLLKALGAVDKAAVDVCQYFDKNVSKVSSNLGWEQEYFLVDEGLFMARPDLMLTERTLMGHSSSKDQQLEDHYFSSIPERVIAYMEDFEHESYLLGIPVKTRHNEVAPNQFEIAPIFEECNLANDHNQLIMDVMKRIARKHGFRILFHEKPFKGINGSGKHNNWSLSTDTGVNLLSPGKNPRTNMQFLTFLLNVMKAVYEHQDLLLGSILTASNMHRLGANEAPPSIISVFLGHELNRVLDELEETVPDKKMTPDEKTSIKLNIGKIPEILLDNTDRNRTSPFAFTGNRFEYRAVGSSANCASAMIVLNTIVAEQLKKFKSEVDGLIEKGVKKDEAILQTLKRYIKETKKIRFDGNGYSAEWVEEAARRGLYNISNAPEALHAYLTDKSKALFAANGVFEPKELEARVEVEMEKYTKKIQIESRVLGDIAINHIVPTGVKYMNTLITNVQGLKDVFGDTADFNELAGDRVDLIKKTSYHIKNIKNKVHEMVEARKVANKEEDAHKAAELYDKTVRPYLDDIRYHIDKLELIVDNEMWPLPKYRELLFAR